MFYNSASWPEGRKAGCLKYTHIVLCVDEKKAKRLKQKAIIIRWHKLFKGNLLTQKYLSGEPLNPAEKFTLDEMTQKIKVGVLGTLSSSVLSLVGHCLLLRLLHKICIYYQTVSNPQFDNEIALPFVGVFLIVRSTE
ncbi:hypothetical protein [Pseudoalteromonas spongiae]|uniref:hypothetical protein n=1 Tax=Pseudoalteromonas spongiae TaxID=298657 RepID=UPI0039FBE27C